MANPVFRRAAYHRLSDGAVVVRLQTANGHCNLCMVSPQLAVAFYANCPPVSVYELIRFLIQAAEHIAVGK